MLSDLVLKAEVLKSGALRIVAKIIDNEAWEKVVSGVYKGFSIGGVALKWVAEKVGEASVKKITQIRLIEISLVDRPANPEAKILLWKGANMAEEKKRVQKAAGPNNQGAVEMLQELRNQVELAGDLKSAQMYSDAIALALQAGGADVTVVAEPVEES